MDILSGHPFHSRQGCLRVDIRITVVSVKVGVWHIVVEVKDTVQNFLTKNSMSHTPE